MHVSEKFRRKGFAHLLFEKVIALKYAEGVKRFALGVEKDNTAARAFYEAMGFRFNPNEDSIRYRLKGEDLDIFMKKITK